MTQRKQAVAAYMRNRLGELSADPNESRVRAQLANLRRGIGRKPGDMPELWGMLFAEMPEEMLSQNGQPTREEWAIYTALTLYALHQQSSKISEQNMHAAEKPENRLGRAVARLVKDEENDRERIARRFNAFATADDMLTAAHHLRGLIQLLRAEEIPLDYVHLAENLYDFQNPDSRPSVRLEWGQDFYEKPRTANEAHDEQKGQDESHA